MDQKENLAKLLRQIAATVEHASPGDLEALFTGRAKLVISNGGTRRSAKRDSVDRFDGATHNKLDSLVEQIKTLVSRDDGLNLLRSEKLSKKELERIARLMDLPVTREDDAERLRLKIVEQSIGARLNSRAIRG